MDFFCHITIYYIHFLNLFIAENTVDAEVVKNSKLSAEAAEFVPQSFSPAPAPVSN